jgi:hypothetical protein
VVSTDADFDAGGLFFCAYQVVNHSRGFATVHQVRTNPEVSLTPVSDLIHTNIIESLWRDLKVFIRPRYRNAQDCPGKILEYLWRQANKGALVEGMRRCLREVAFIPPQRAEGRFEAAFVTVGEDGESQEQQEVRLAREQAWVSRRRQRDEEDVSLDSSESDGGSDDDGDYIPARPNAAVNDAISAVETVLNDDQVEQSVPTVEAQAPLRRSNRFSAASVSVPGGAVSAQEETTDVPRHPVGRPRTRQPREGPPRQHGRPPRVSRGRGRPRSRA